jgi:hypothetical protein
VTEGQKKIPRREAAGSEAVYALIVRRPSSSSSPCRRAAHRTSSADPP